MSQRRRPTIVTERDLRELTAEVVRAIVKANEPDPSVFRFGSSLARIRILDDSASLEILSVDKLVNHLANVGRFCRRGRKGKLVSAIPPRSVARNILAEPVWPVHQFNV